MLQRAANDACSWWWASHLRTKQSKWLQQSLQDMEGKVQDVLKLLDQDGDSFAKRAEMYYKRRPELIDFVEETFRAFRALAERYDHLSRDLQKANHTLGAVCPEKCQFTTYDDDESVSPSFRRPPESPKLNRAAIKYLQYLKTTGLEPSQSQSQPQSPSQACHRYASKAVESNEAVEKSGLSRSEAVREIDKLKKEILILQTVKEFVKTSFESGIAKYKGIEKEMREMQQKLCKLQDEFNVETIANDVEAQTIMAETALKSCEETLLHLQEKQEKYIQAARDEYKKIEDASRRIKSLRDEFLKDETDVKTTTLSDDTSENIVSGPEKCKQVDSSESLTVMELSEKIDELVSKVIGLETGMSSQNVLINRLRTEVDDLNSQIFDLEKEKETLIDENHTLTIRVKELEERLQMIQELNKNLQDQNSNLQSNFTQARSSLDQLSYKLTTAKPDEEREVTVVEVKLHEDIEQKKAIQCEDKKTENVKDVVIVDEGREPSNNNHSRQDERTTKKTVTFLEPIPTKDVFDGEKKEEELNWQLMLLNGLEDREKFLLTEYTAILRNYKDARRKLSDMEKKEKDAQFETTVQVRGMKSAIAKRDAEIRQLRQKLNLPEVKLGDNNDFELNDDHNLDEKDKNSTISVIELKLQRDIDAILDGNLEFWLRFSSAFQQIKKFQIKVQDLRDEVVKLKEKKKQEESNTLDLRPDCRVIYKHLREIQTELKPWVEQNIMLKNELNRRFESLSRAEQEIKKAFEGCEEDEMILKSYQAAKFQGEISNMKQEFKKVEQQVQAGLDHVIAFQLESELTLRKLNDEFGVAGDQQQSRHSTNRPRVPLRVFIFGTKPKKNRRSIFSCIRPNRKFQGQRGNMSTKGY